MALSRQGKYEETIFKPGSQTKEKERDEALLVGNLLHGRLRPR